jgi:hypothetical protein
LTSRFARQRPQYTAAAAFKIVGVNRGISNFHEQVQQQIGMTLPAITPHNNPTSLVRSGHFNLLVAYDGE